MREIIKLKRVSMRNDAEACVTRLMRETWHLCQRLLDILLNRSSDHAGGINKCYLLCWCNVLR